jgi:hypothetical protein
VPKAKASNCRIVDTDMAYAGWAKFLILTIQMPDGRKVGRPELF